MCEYMWVGGLTSEATFPAVLLRARLRLGPSTFVAPTCSGCLLNSTGQNSAQRKSPNPHPVVCSPPAPLHLQESVFPELWAAPIFTGLCWNGWGVGKGALIGKPCSIMASAAVGYSISDSAEDVDTDSELVPIAAIDITILRRQTVSSGSPLWIPRVASTLQSLRMGRGRGGSGEGVPLVLLNYSNTTLGLTHPSACPPS